MRLITALALTLSVACVTDSELEAALDRDRDGYLPVQAGGDDCDETRSSVNPAADEICGDGVDNDCDGIPDDDGVGARTFFRDADGDGFGVEDETVSACTRPEGFAEFIGDCDDGDPSFNPAVQDLCDGLDQDCDGLADDDDVLETRYVDNDLDGFGTEESAVLTCQNDPQLVALVGDCDDDDSSINPTATDVCDGIDQDCDGVVDDDAVSFTQYRDDDGDGWGVEADSDTFCELLPGFAPLPGDCDDTNAGISPEALDLCDGVDQNCDGFVDEDAIELVYYFDGDGDGAGSDTNAVASCEPLSGYVLQGGDCDDADGAISPLATDVCDGIDQNCNGAIDEDALNTLYFEDLDDDGRGNDDVSVEACTAPPGFVQLGGDCNDEDGSIRPGVSDQCDGVDQDCDGLTDEDTPLLEYFPDADGDGAGTDTGSQLSCTPLSGHALIGGDCDDGDASISPLLDDVCDGVDQNCNGITDEDALVLLWYEDADGDGSGNLAVTAEACAQPSDFVQMSGDCDDTDASIRPGASDLCDGIDQDCDGEDDEDATFATFYPDQDGDGVGNAAGEILICDTPPVDFVADAGDCDDTDASVIVPSWYRDDDNDGAGLASEAIQQCSQPAGFAEDSGDCDDVDPARSPSFQEVCRTNIDEDCDDTTDCLPGAVVDLLIDDTFTSSFDLDSSVPGLWSDIFVVGDIAGIGGADDFDYVLTTDEDQFFVVNGDAMNFDSPIGPFPYHCDRIVPTNADGGAWDDFVCIDGNTVRLFSGSAFFNPGISPIRTWTDAEDIVQVVQRSTHGPGFFARDDAVGSDRIVFVPFSSASGSVGSAATMWVDSDSGDEELLNQVPCVDGGTADCAVLITDGFFGLKVVSPNQSGDATSSATVWSILYPPTSDPDVLFYIFPPVTLPADVDGNGEADLAFFTGDGLGLEYLPGPVSSTTTAELVADVTGVEAFGFPFGDFDGDGLADHAGFGGTFLTMDYTTVAGGSGSDTAIINQSGLQLRYPDVVDIDGDGFEDIIFLQFAHVRILWGTGI